MGDSSKEGGSDFGTTKDLGVLCWAPGKLRDSSSGLVLGPFNLLSGPDTDKPTKAVSSIEVAT